MDRRIITVLIYAAIIVILPQQRWFIDIANPLYGMDRMLVLIINAVAIAIALGGMWAMRKYGYAFATARPRVADVCMQGLFGLFFGGAITVIEYFANMSISIVWLVLIPLASMAADIIYLTFAWRAKNSPLD